MMGFVSGHEFVPTAWRDVPSGKIVRTKDGRHWRLRDWNGERVLLEPCTEHGIRSGPAVPVALVDGSKQVDVMQGIPVKPRTPAPEPLGVTPHEYRPGNGGCWWADCSAPEDDAVHTPPDFARPVEQPGPSAARPFTALVQSAADEVADLLAMADAGLLGDAAQRRAATRFGHAEPDAPATMTEVFAEQHPERFAEQVREVAEVPLVELAKHVTVKPEDVGEPDADRPKFGQPADTRTAGETLYGVVADDEGRAVAALAKNFPDAELIAVEDVVDGVLVPRQLDDLALRSHLFLMHGRFYGETDTERADLERDHRAAHTGDPGHEHVDRAELPR